MKRYISLIAILIAGISLHAQYDFLKESIGNYGSAPSYLVVNVQSPSYKGQAVIRSTLFYRYYVDIEGRKSIKKNRYVKLASGDIRRGRFFPISDDYFIADDCDDIKNRQDFYKMVIDSTVLRNSERGIDTFVNIYFLGNGDIKSSLSDGEFFTVIKVLFDAGIQVGIRSDYGYTRIQDPRFYNEKGSFVIPLEYRSG